MKKEMEKIAKKEVKKHEKSMHGKGYAKGGVTNEMLKESGRNMARVINQRGSSRGR